MDDLTEELELAPRAYHVVLAIYKDDLANPRHPPVGGFHMDLAGVVKHVPYEQIPDGRCPPYLIYIDCEHKELILTIRGLNLARESDYTVMLDNRLGSQMFDGGFVHHSHFLLELAPHDHLIFMGHSLGFGITTLMTVIAVNHRDQFGGIARSQIRCYAIAPVRCMSLNLAVK